MGQPAFSSQTGRCHRLHRFLCEEWVPGHNDQGPVVQGIVNLTSSLKGEVLKCFMSLLPKTIFFVEKMGEAFALQKLFPFFQQGILANFNYKRLKI